MTLLIIFLAVTNMAVGYGLAIYLGQGQLPLPTRLPRMQKRRAAAVTAVENGSTASNISDPQHPTDSDVVSEPDQAIETTTRVEPDEPSPPLVAPKQLDLSDLMPAAEPTIEDDDSAGEVPGEVAVAGNPTATPTATTPLDAVDKPIPEASITAATESLAEIEASDHQAARAAKPAVEPAVEPTVETSVATAAENAKDDTKENRAATTNEEPGEIGAAATPTDSTPGESLAEVTAKVGPAEVGEGVEPEPSEVADTEVASSPPISDRQEVEEADAEVAEGTSNELDSLAQQLQQAMAEARVEEDTAEDAVGDNRVVAKAKSSQVAAATVSEYALSGLESFQLQLQKQVKPDAGAVVGEERYQTGDNNPPAIEDAPDEAMALKGSGDFPGQIESQQPTSGMEAETVLEGAAAFRSPLQSQQEIAVDAKVDPEPAAGSSLEPEVLAGIESFRMQLAKMNEAPVSIPTDASLETGLEPISH